MYRVTVIVFLLSLGLAGCVSDERIGDGESNGDGSQVGSISGLQSIAWPGDSTTSRSSTAALQSTSTSVAPVSSLISGLESRLAERPDDVKGWALLAQSYAFIADGPRAEEAISHAVELGFEEADLRNRVELAFQSAGSSVQDPNASEWTHPVIDE